MLEAESCWGQRGKKDGWKLLGTKNKLIALSRILDPTSVSLADLNGGVSCRIQVLGHKSTCAPDLRSREAGEASREEGTAGLAVPSCQEGCQA
jgi:hypothetical protein